MLTYLINFIVWWYLVKCREYLTTEVFGGFIFQMNITRTLPMVRNFTTPLFRDSSGFGKAISVFIKFWWIGFGTLLSLIKTLPKFIIFIVLVSVPIIPLIQILLFITRSLI